jgi:hypothetical protein
MYIDYARSYKRQRRKQRRESTGRMVMLVILILAIGFAVYFWGLTLLPLRKKEMIPVHSNQNAVVKNRPVYDSTGGNNKSLQSVTEQPKEITENAKEAEKAKKEEKTLPSLVPVQVKGIYVTSCMAGSRKMSELVAIARDTEVNAMVIDIKTDEGKITYEMDSALVRQYGSSTGVIPNIQNLIRSLKSKKIYLIARIVAFKDPYLAKRKRTLALKNADGSLYHDNMKGCWVNPYQKAVWKYLLDVASQAAAIGFDEIQFDYMRFPTDGAVAKLNYGKISKSKTKEEIIEEFVKYVSAGLKPLGVFVSADVYGTIIKSRVDAAMVGQNYVELSKYLDYICPMIYPSHFEEGNFGIKYPDLEPRKMIYKVLEVSKNNLNRITQGKHRAIVRPWLQDFTARWVKHHRTYGGDEVRAQINGVYDTGYKEWILWNSGCKYSVDGLLMD